MIIVVGTSHTIQTADGALQPFLERLCRQFSVRGVAEELNKEALADRNCTASIPMQVASMRNIPHRFVDPNRMERAQLGIQEENDIRISDFLSTLPESEVAKRVGENHQRRERYWLEQLQSLNAWPVLFVCGADHVASFCDLVKNEGIVAHIAAEDWAPNNTVEWDAPQAPRPSR